MRMTPCPVWIIRSAGETNHSAIEKKETEQRENHHTEGRTANVRKGIQGNLTPTFRGIVATEFRDKGVSRFMAGGGEQEHDVVDETKDQEVGIKVRHK